MRGISHLRQGNYDAAGRCRTIAAHRAREEELSSTAHVSTAACCTQHSHISPTFPHISNINCNYVSRSAPRYNYARLKSYLVNSSIGFSEFGSAVGHLMCYAVCLHLTCTAHLPRETFISHLISHLISHTSLYRRLLEFR